MHARSLLLALALSTPFAGCSAPPADAPIPVEALHADLEAWEAAVRERHPRWSGRADDPALAEAFDDVAATIDTPLDRHEAFRRFSTLNPVFRDAHTLLMPTSVPPDGGDAALFPFDLRVDGGRLFLRRGWRRESDGLALAAGTEILAINALPTDALLAGMARHGHGETASLRTQMLAVMFGDWLHALHGWTKHFDVRFAGLPGEALRVSTDDGWVPEVGDTARWTPSLDALSPDVAWLRVPTFDVDDDPDRFAEAIDALFATIRESGYRGLVIDVRGNTGGQSEAGAVVARHLVDQPVAPVSIARERLHDGNNGMFGWRGSAGSVRDIELGDEGVVEPLPPTHRFNGRVVLIVDAMTYSAAIVFATMLQDHGVATLVGQSTGGFGNQTGNMEPFVLPATGLLAYIPAREFVRPSGDPRLAPVSPDVEMPTSGQVRDAALERARRIASGESPPITPAAP